jgi:hypothetical protein
VATLLLALVTIAVSNQAAVDDATLRKAQAEAARICAVADIPIVWGESTFRVIVRREPRGGPGASSPSALGTTLGDDHSHGGASFVFYDRVLRLAHKYQQPAAAVLALAIAHEIGHLLLPAPAHTATGLMKPEWDGDDIRRLLMRR